MLVKVKTVHGTPFAINPRDISTIRDDGDNVHVSFTNNSSIDVAMSFDDIVKLMNEHDDVNSYGKMCDTICRKIDELTSVTAGGFGHIAR